MWHFSDCFKTKFNSFRIAFILHSLKHFCFDVAKMLYLANTSVLLCNLKIASSNYLTSKLITLRYAGKKPRVKSVLNSVKLVGGYACHTDFPVVQCGGGSSYKSQLTLRFVALIYPLLLLHLVLSSGWGCPAGGHVGASKNISSVKRLTQSTRGALAKAPLWCSCALCLSFHMPLWNDISEEHSNSVPQMRKNCWVSRLCAVCDCLGHFSLCLNSPAPSLNSL